MSMLLRIDASIRLDGSVSRALADSAEAAWRAEHPDGVVIRRDLGAHPLPPTAWPTVAAAGLGLHAPPGADRANLAEATALAQEVTAELTAADAVLLAVPLYNYGISQHVKTWIDLLMIDRQLAYGPSPVRGRPVILALAHGGGYGAGAPKEGWDHATPYLERIFGDVFGMTVHKVLAELTLAEVTPGMEPLVDAAKLSRKLAHVTAEEHGSVIARSVTSTAA